MAFQKQILVLLVSLLCVDSSRGQDSLLVLTTTSVFADMANNIAGGRLRVESIVPVGISPHQFDISGVDTALIGEADLVMFNGLGLEPWLDTLLLQYNPGLSRHLLTTGIQPLELSGDGAGTHAWMSAERGLTYLEQIKKGLSTLAPHDADIFGFNHDLYRQELLDLDLLIQSLFLDLPGEKRVLLTLHDPFHYFGERYGLRTGALGLNPVISADTPLVFFESTVDTAALRDLAEGQGIKLAGPLYADTVSDSAGPAPTYLEMLSYDAHLIAEELKEAPLREERSGWMRYGLPTLLLLLVMMLIWRLFERRRP